jgi:hypothetical protein
MATRAVSVVVERSPGGLRGWFVKVGQERKWASGGSEDRAITVAMILLGADIVERERVSTLIRSELRRKRRAEVTAEVANV